MTWLDELLGSHREQGPPKRDPDVFPDRTYVRTPAGQRVVFHTAELDVRMVDGRVRIATGREAIVADELVEVLP